MRINSSCVCLFFSFDNVVRTLTLCGVNVVRSGLCGECISCCNEILKELSSPMIRTVGYVRGTAGMTRLSNVATSAVHFN